MRNFKDYLLIFFKGMAMGAADVVPGVSGGTIAFIVGIYDELLSSISSINLSLIKDLKTKGLAHVWKKINGNFLLALITGVGVSILSFAKLLSFLMHYYPIQLWAFFFGLIIASIWYVGKTITKWNISSLISIVLGTIFIWYLSTMPPLGATSSYLFLFFAGAIAACAMILPGISGSFILLLLGAYTTVITAVGNQDLIIIAVVGFGAILGLLSFSKLLKYLLDKFPNQLIGVLTGFLIGSLWKIWPWKVDSKVYVKEEGIKNGNEVMENGYSSLSAYLKQVDTTHFEKIKPYVENNINPFVYSELNNGISANLSSALLFAVIGFSIIFIIEFSAKLKNV